MALWDKLLPREREISKPEGGVAFGICACSPANDGTFEYIAAFEAAPGAKVPAAMNEWNVGGVDYAVVRMPNLAAVGQGWERVKAISADPSVETYCGPKGCHCAEHAPFELYPADFTPESEFFIYVPLRTRPS